MKHTLEITEADGIRKPAALKIEKGVDLRENHEYREAARAMEIGDSVGELSKESAGKLYRAIEEIHGARTATIRERDGQQRVWRIAERPVRTRAARREKGDQ